MQSVVELKETDILQILTDEKFKNFYSIGIIDERAIRTCILRSEFIELRKNHTQIESINILSEKHNIAFGTLNTIIFRKKSRKTFSIEKYFKGLSTNN